jgi:hypothetical protein
VKNDHPKTDDMRLALISLSIIAGVSTVVACGGPMDAGSPGPAQTPNAARDPAAIDPADEIRSDDPGGNDGGRNTDAPPKNMGTDPSRTPQMSTSAVTTGGFLPTSSSGSSGSSGSTGAGPITGSTGTGFR